MTYIHPLEGDMVTTLRGFPVIMPSKGSAHSFEGFLFFPASLSHHQKKLYNLTR